MQPTDLSARPVVRLAAEDVRRVPMMGIAVGIAITATVLSIIEKSPLMPWIVGAMWLAVAGTVLAVLPIANSLTLTPEGFRVRVLGFLGGSVAWSDVELVEAGEGWAGAAVVVHLREGAAARSIPGLPRDPTLGVSSLVDHYGRDPEELAGEMERRRKAAAAAAGA